MNAKSHSAAVMLNDVLARLGWYGWFAYGTDEAYVVTLQYRREDGTVRAVDCRARDLLGFIRQHPRRCDVVTVCDRKPASLGRATQQEINFSESPALVRDALNPNKQ